MDVAKYESDIVPGGGAPVHCYATVNISQIIGKEPERTLIYPCPSGYCKKTDTSTWAASDSDVPCVAYREGFLCGQCTEGYAVTPLSNVSLHQLSFCVGDGGWTCHFVVIYRVPHLHSLQRTVYRP